MGSENLARRFLHVNLNCTSLDTTEGIYAGRLGLSARMRTDAKVATDGSILGIDGDYINRSRLAIDGDCFVARDLNRSLADLTAGGTAGLEEAFLRLTAGSRARHDSQEVSR